MRPDELDEYLRGDSELSRQYRREPAPSPPRTLDRQVLRRAREMQGKTPCLAPLALAASVLLSVALVLAIIFGPQTVQRADDKPHVLRTAAHAALPQSAPLSQEFQLYSSDPPSHLSPLRSREPAAWLADIAALRRGGRVAEADAELRRFRRIYPHYDIGAAD
jgi:hypothetical protein